MQRTAPVIKTVRLVPQSVLEQALEAQVVVVMEVT
jgi:hypothetical protein